MVSFSFDAILWQNIQETPLPNKWSKTSQLRNRIKEKMSML